MAPSLAFKYSAEAFLYVPTRLRICFKLIRFDLLLEIGLACTSSPTPAWQLVKLLGLYLGQHRLQGLLYECQLKLLALTSIELNIKIYFVNLPRIRPARINFDSFATQFSYSQL